MRMLRNAPAAFVAVLMLGAIASASASAAACTVETGGKLPVYCVGPKTDQDGTLTNETVKSNRGPFQLITAGGGFNIECSAEADTAEISSSEAAAGTSKNVKIAFTGCKVEGTSTFRCTVTDAVGEVPGTITVPATTSALKTVGGKIYDVFGPEGGTFVTIEIDQVTGQVCAPKSPALAMKGQPCGEASLTLAKEAPLTFSSAIQTECGAELYYGGAKSGWLQGISKQELLGAFEAANKGAEWAVMLT